MQLVEQVRQPTAQKQRDSEKPPRCRNGNQAHNDDSEGDEEADGMPGPKACAEQAVRNNLPGGMVIIAWRDDLSQRMTPKIEVGFHSVLLSGQVTSRY